MLKRIEVQNVNITKLHDELLAAGITPELVESIRSAEYPKNSNPIKPFAWITIDEVKEADVLAVVSLHETTPIKSTKTKLEILQETVDMLVLESLEG